MIILVLLFSFILSQCPNDCSGNGRCIDDECICQQNYYWSDCSVFKCYNVRNDNPFVCNGHGECNSVDTCQCDDGYSGDNCNTTTCFDIKNDDPEVCSGNGLCNEIDTCECFPGYGGEQCDVYTCNLVLSTDASVCGGNGVCEGPNVCNCEEGFSGKDCTETSCYGRKESDPNVCSAGGVCIDGLCECLDGYEGNECERHQCYGIWDDDETVCNGRGTCLGKDYCDCEDEYTGNNCQFRMCYGKHAVMVDTFEPLSTKFNEDIWDVLLTKAETHDEGCGAVSASGRSFFFYGPVENRVAVTNEIPVEPLAKQEYTVSFNFLMATGSGSCDAVVSTDYVEARIVQGDEEKVFATLTPLKYANRNTKVKFSFIPTDDFRIKLIQPDVYNEDIGEWAIDNFMISVDGEKIESHDAPCNWNGICESDGTCTCYRGSGDECKIEEGECQIPTFSNYEPTEGYANAETELTITGCFDEKVTKCRFYASWKTASTGIEVDAVRSDDGTKLTCYIPSQKDLETSEVRFDVYSEREGVEWQTYKGAIFQYVKTSGKAIGSTSTSATTQNGSIVSSGVFWTRDDMTDINFDSIDISLTLYFIELKEFGWVSNIYESPFIVRYKQIEGVLKDLERYSTLDLERDDTLRPSISYRLYEMEAECYYHGTTVQVPCYSLVRKREIEMSEDLKTEYCDNWVTYWRNDDLSWNDNLRECPLTISLVKAHEMYEPDLTCSADEEWLDVRDCNYFYEDAYECYVSKLEDSNEGYVQRRCCYDTNEQLIRNGCSQGHSYYCAAGQTCQPPTEAGEMVNHYDGDILPLEICATYLERCDEYEERRPSKGPFGGGYKSGTCSFTGDPHITTFDGRYYHYYGQCDFWIIKSNYLNVQARFVGSGPSVTTAVVFQNTYHSTDIFQAQIGTSQTVVRVNGQTVDFSQVNSLGKNFLSFSSNGRSVTFKYKTGETIRFDGYTSSANLYISGLDAEVYLEATKGMCGIWDHNPANDLTTRSGVVTTDTVATTFGDSWRVQSDENLFTWFTTDTRYINCGTVAPVTPTPPVDPSTLFTDEDEKNAVTEACNKYVDEDKQNECILDAFYMGKDEVIDQSISSEEYLTDLFQESTILPGIEFGVEDPIARRLSHTLIGFKLEGGDEKIVGILNAEVTKLELKENFDYYLFDSEKEKDFTYSIIEVDAENYEYAIDIYFENVLLVNKIFTIEVTVGSQVYGFVDKTIDFKTYCENGYGGETCTENACNDIAASEEDFVCDGKGTCTGPNTCVCDGLYKGSNCEYGYTADSIQMASIILDDPIINSWEKLVVSSDVILPNGASGTKVYYKWSLKGEKELFEKALITPSIQSEIAFAPDSFEPDSIHTLLLEVRSELGSVKTEKVFHVVPELPSEYIQVTAVEGEVNTFNVDVSNYLFTDKTMTYSFIDPDTETEVILLRTTDPIVTLTIPSKVEGVVTLRITVFHYPSKKKVVRDESVQVVESSFDADDVEKYIENLDLFGDSLTSNAYFLREVAYLIAWLNEFPSFSLSKMEDYRTQIFNGLVKYSSVLDEDQVDEFLIILNGLTVNIKEFPAPKGDTLFEVTFSQILDQFISLMEGHDFDNKKTERTIHDSYHNIIYCLLVLRASSSKQDDVNEVLNSYDSLLGNYLKNKINGEITSYESDSLSYMSTLSTEQELSVLESQEVKIAESVYFSLPIYPEDTETTEIQIKAMVFDENPYNAESSTQVNGIETTPTIRLKVQGKAKSEFYIVRIEGKFTYAGFKYFDQDIQEWVRIDQSITPSYASRRSDEPQIYVTKKTSTGITFESNMDDVAFVFVDETPYGLITALAILFPSLALTCILALVVVGIVILVVFLAKRAKANKKRPYDETASKFEKFDEEEMDNKKEYEKRMQSENIQEGKVANALSQYE